MDDKLQEYVLEQLREGQKFGYILPENDDLEVGQWMGAVSYQIGREAERLLEPDLYFKHDGKIYKVADLAKLEEAK